MTQLVIRGAPPREMGHSRACGRWAPPAGRTIFPLVIRPRHACSPSTGAASRAGRRALAEARPLRPLLYYGIESHRSPVALPSAPSPQVAAGRGRAGRLPARAHAAYAAFSPMEAPARRVEREGDAAGDMAAPESQQPPGPPARRGGPRRPPAASTPAHEVLQSRRRWWREDTRRRGVLRGCRPTPEASAPTPRASRQGRAAVAESGACASQRGRRRPGSACEPAGCGRSCRPVAASGSAAPPRATRERDRCPRATPGRTNHQAPSRADRGPRATGKVSASQPFATADDRAPARPFGDGRLADGDRRPPALSPAHDANRMNDPTPAPADRR
jgi:hypothetical protein